MKTKLLRALMACLLMATAASCTTVYDPYGRPRTVVEPEAAVLGAAAAGLAGYAIARNRDYDHHYYPRRHSYYGHRPHYYYY